MISTWIIRILLALHLIVYSFDNNTVSYSLGTVTVIILVLTLYYFEYREATSSPPQPRGSPTRINWNWQLSAFLIAFASAQLVIHYAIGPWITTGVLPLQAIPVFLAYCIWFISHCEFTGLLSGIRIMRRVQDL